MRERNKRKKRGRKRMREESRIRRMEKEKKIPSRFASFIIVLKSNCKNGGVAKSASCLLINVFSGIPLTYFSYLKNTFFICKKSVMIRMNLNLILLFICINSSLNVSSPHIKLSATSSVLKKNPPPQKIGKLFSLTSLF